MATSYTAESVGNLLKKYYESGTTEQFYDDNLFLKRIEKNSRDIKGGTATCGLHAGRNAGVGAASNGGEYGTPGKQSVYQTTIDLKYIYSPTILSGPDMENAKGDAGSFANVLTLNQDGAIADLKKELSRMLNADGTGFIALASTDASTVTQSIHPYLWSDVSSYLPAGRQLEIRDIATGASSNTSSGTSTTRSNAPTVASVTTVGGVSTAIVQSVDQIGTSAAGDGIGTFGAVQLSAGNAAFAQYEPMGLWGLVHNTDIAGSSAYKYDAGDYGNTAVTNFTNSEGASADWAGPTSSTCTNTVQGLATASYSWWKSLVFGNGGVPRALSLQLMDRMIAKLKTERGSKLTAIYTTWQVEQKLKDLVRQDRRYVDSMDIDGGVRVSAYNGIPIFVSQDNARGTMYFLDESEFVFYDKKGYFFLSDSRANIMHKVSQQDLYEITGAVYCNLGCRSRWRQGKIMDILE